MTRQIALSVLVTTFIGMSAALAQVPGQIPGTLPPGSPIPPPPPAPAVQTAPRAVPSVVTPLPTPSYGIPPGVTRPVIGGSSPLRVYGHAPARKQKEPRRHRRRHVSESSSRK